MRDLIEQLLAAGALDGLDPADLSVPHLLRGLMLVRRGALHAAVDDLARVRRWQPAHFSLLRAGAAPERWLNLFCEVYEHGFDGCGRIYDGVRDHLAAGCGRKDPMRLGLLWGVLLGDRVDQAWTFYRTSPEFLTRVVGLRYDNRLERLDGLNEGEPVHLAWEPHNPHDPNAIRVRSAAGEDLGFLRRTLAELLAPQIRRRGLSLSGEVACVLPEEFDPNVRLHILVRATR